MTTDERIQQAAKKYRNWGKWGKDDQLGTLNYITPEKIIQAARLVRAGRVILTIPRGRRPAPGAGSIQFTPLF
jgi:hypothetical protein